MTRTHGTSKAPGAVAQLLAGQENLVEKIGLIVAQLQAIESGAAGSSQQQATMLASLNAQRGEVRSAELLAHPRSAHLHSSVPSTAHA